jgi:hypothetical protein
MTLAEFEEATKGLPKDLVLSFSYDSRAGGGLINLVDLCLPWDEDDDTNMIVFRSEDVYSCEICDEDDDDMEKGQIISRLFHDKDAKYVG